MNKDDGRVICNFIVQNNIDITIFGNGRELDPYFVDDLIEGQCF